MLKIIKLELRKYLAICEEIDKCQRSKELIRSKYDIKSTSIIKISSSDYSTEDKVIKMISELDKIDLKLNELMLSRDKIIDIIIKVPQPTRKLLFEHYCLGYTLEEVAKKYHYSISSLRRKIDKEIERI